jgi:hypothetical protein|tara:strand:- start:12020 stop:12319 length:300 start_codon:yes stop_codon:yes gene_type:complete
MAARVTATVLVLSYTAAVATQALTARTRELVGMSIDGYTIGGVAALLWFSQNPEFAEEVGAGWTVLAGIAALRRSITQVQIDNARLRVAMWDDELATPP